MPEFRIKSKLLGVDIRGASDDPLTEADQFDVLKRVVPRQKMLQTYARGRKSNDPVQKEATERLALKAYDHGFFDTEADFSEAVVEAASSVGRGIKKIVMSPRQKYHLELLDDNYLPYYPKPGGETYDASAWEAPIQKAANQLLGLAQTSKGYDWRDLLKKDPQTPWMVGNLDASLAYAGLPKNNFMRREVIDQAMGLRDSQASATRGQAAVEGLAGLALIGQKVGVQWGSEALDVLTLSGSERGDKLHHLDFMVEFDKISETMERGAEIAAANGGAYATIRRGLGSPLQSKPGTDQQTYDDVVSGAVKPDRDVALVLSIGMDPSTPATIAASGGLSLYRSVTARAWIKETYRKATQEAALKATVNQLSEIANPTRTQRALLTSAQKKLEKVAGSGERLAALTQKNAGVAQAQLNSLSASGLGDSPSAARLRGALESTTTSAPLLNRATGKALGMGGKGIEYAGRALEFMQRLPAEVLETSLIKGGMSADRAAMLAANIRHTALGVGGLVYATEGFSGTPDLLDAIGGVLISQAGPGVMARLGSDVAILGKQLQYAQNSLPLFQRLAQIDPTDDIYSRAILDRTAALTYGETVSGLASKVFDSSRRFGVSPATQLPARFLSRTGLGNTITGGVNLGKQAAAGASIPMGIGYAVGGEEGAGAALGVSLPLIATGLGMGAFARYASPADLQAKLIGDEAYFVDTYLDAADRTAFGKLPRTVRQALATSRNQNPDVVYNFNPDGKGRGSSYWAIEDGESVVTIFTGDRPENILSALLGHEIAHHIDAYGFQPQITEALLGNAASGETGVFTKYDKDGKPIVVKNANGIPTFALNEEFQTHRQQYLDALERGGMGPETDAYKNYATNPEMIAREIFASHGAAYYFGNEFVKQNYKGAGAKMMGAILSPIFNTSATRKFFHRIGLATEEGTGLVADPTGLFPGLKEIPGLTKMIRKYNDDVRGFGPQARREGQGRGNLVDSQFKDEIASVNLTAKDLENPAIVDRLKAGGHVKIREDGKLDTDASGRPIFLPTRQVNQNNKAMTQDILDILEKKEASGDTFGPGHLALEETADGGRRATGKFIDDSIIGELRKTGRYNEHQLDALQAISRGIKDGSGDAWNLFYYSALKWNKAGRKVYGSIKGGDRLSLPFGIEISKDGNILVNTISIDAFRKNLEWFAKSKGFKEKFGKAFGGENEHQNVQAAQKLLPQYLRNHMEGRANDESSGISAAQRDFINAAIGRINEEHVKKNPILEGLGDRRSKRQQSFRSRRLDRIGNAHRGDKIGTPQLRLIEQNLNPRQHLPAAAYHGTPHTFKAEEGAPLGRFRSSQIGTGEGAQAYGHGLYFAGKKEVAEFYREQLAPALTKNFRVGTMDVVKDEVPMDYSPDKLKRVYGGEANARAALVESLLIDEQTIRRAFIEDGEEGAKREVRKVIQDFLDSYEGEATYEKVGKKALDMPVKFEALEPGSVYKVELAPKENEYLYWDKPLSEQPKGVREKLESELKKRMLPAEMDADYYVISDGPKRYHFEIEKGRSFVSLRNISKKELDGLIGSQAADKIDASLESAPDLKLAEARGSGKVSLPGKTIYEDLVREEGLRWIDPADNPKAAASAALKEAGIPGIKYLDGDSRGKGKGDYNYVIFDEADVAITDKLFMPALDDARLKSLEGDKNAVQADLTIADYPANPNPDSVALPARMGLVNPKVAGMPKTYNEVRKMITDQVDRIIAVAKKFPGFAKRAANFYGDMAESALLMADAAMVKGRSIFDVADLQLRFLALGSPRSAVPGNASKSARSIAAAGGELAGHKINPGDQQTAANSTARAWDDGGHFDPSLKGVDDKVRNFYLNGIAELIDKAKRQGTPEDVQMLQQRAAYTLGFLKPGQDMSPQTLTKLERFLDGLATVDMWDMAGKGYAHPAYVKRGKGRGQKSDMAFHWSVPKHAENRTMSGDIWRQAMEDMGIESPMDLDYRQARALMVDGRKDWNADTWAERVKEGFDKDTKWVSFSKADEGGLNPGGGGPLYDAHQTIDGLIADELNARGFAEAFGKTKLVARNAQEILWAIEKLDNPLPANQKLVLFGDRVKPFFDAIQYLRLQGDAGYMPPAAQSILTVIRDTYAKTSSQSIPLEIVTQGQSRRAATVQRQEAALGDTVLTEAVASGLLGDLQRVADLHEVPIVVDEVKVGRGGYEENGNAAVAPNVVITLRGDPAHTGKVMEALSFSVDQDGGNLIRKPTIEELNNPKTELNNAIVFNTNHLQPDQLSAFFLDLAALKDKQGNSFLTGFTQTKDGMFIGDQFYGGDMVAEAAAQRPKIKQIMAKYGVVEDKSQTVVIETFHRLNREPAAQHVFHRHAREILGNPFTRDLHRLLQDRVKNASQEKAGGLPQARQGTRRVMQRAQEAVEREYGSAKNRSSVMDALLADVDLMLLRGEVDSDGAGALKGQVKELFKATPFRKAHRSQAKKLKRAVDKTRKDEKQPMKKRKAALWSQRGEYSPKGKWEPAGPGQFARKVQQLMTKGQKSIDLLPSGSREKTGVQLPARFQKDPTRTGKWRKK